MSLVKVDYGTLGGDDDIIGVEKAIGKIQIDNNVYTKYRKILQFNIAYDNDGMCTKAHGISSFIRILKIDGTIKGVSENNKSIPYVASSAGLNASVGIYISNTQIILMQPSKNFNGENVIMTLEYYR